MIPERYQSISDILSAASPEQRILWQQIRLICGDNAALRQIQYNGPASGTEFLTYQATKLYLALKIDFHGGGAPLASPGYIVRYNEANAATDYIQVNSMGWDATAAAFRYIAASYSISNIYFSRLQLSIYGSINFVGYRIIY